MPCCQRSYWAVNLPMRNGPGEIGKVLVAVAELELGEPQVRVIDLAIRREPGNSRRGTAVINVSALARD